MVSSVVLSVGIVDDDKEKKNQPDEWNDHRFDHVPLLCCCASSKGYVWSGADAFKRKARRCVRTVALEPIKTSVQRIRVCADPRLGRQWRVSEHPVKPGGSHSFPPPPGVF